MSCLSIVLKLVLLCILHYINCEITVIYFVDCTIKDTKLKKEEECNS
jgi:hypothetical protein